MTCAGTDCVYEILRIGTATDAPSFPDKHVPSVFRSPTRLYRPQPERFPHRRGKPQGPAGQHPADEVSPSFLRGNLICRGCHFRDILYADSGTV